MFCLRIEHFNETGRLAEMFWDYSDSKLQYCRAKFVGGLQLFESDPTFYLTAADEAHMHQRSSVIFPLTSRLSGEEGLGKVRKTW